MKKLISIALTLALLLGAVPVAVSAATSTDGIVDKHGAKTYVGTAAAWSAAWNQENFAEVTDEDVIYTGNLTIKSGEIKDVTVKGDTSKLIVTTGTMSDIVCAGTTEIAGGTIQSIQSADDVTLKGGTVKYNVECDSQVTISGKTTVGGSVIANDIVSGGSTGATISDSILGYHSITLTGNSLKVGEIKGNGTTELDLKNYDGKLPKVTDVDTIVADGSSSVTANGRITAGTLSIQQKGEFNMTSLLELDYLVGPGTLSFDPGELLIHKSISSQPLFVFNTPVEDGTDVFKADENQVNEDDVLLYDYNLEKRVSGDYDVFELKSDLTEGITFNTSELTVDSKTPVTVKAKVKPNFSDFATGTRIVWELHGETSVFSISPNSSDNTCKVTVSSSATGTYKATLVAYLVDQKGARLTDYKSDTCLLTTGSGAAPDAGSVSGITLDTSTVTIGVGNSYWVLAITDAKTAPTPMSYNSSVAVVGKGVAYNSNGKVGWVYPVTAIAKGGVTIDIGGQKMVAAVAGGSIVVDTSSYTMSPGGKYCIGVKMNGLKRTNLNVHSGNSNTTVQFSGTGKDSTDLYLIKANQVGIGYVVFEVIGGQSVSTQINVENGAKAHGVSGRLVAAG